MISGKKSDLAWPLNQVELYRGIGQRIREVRAARGMTQEKLAELIHLTRTSLVNIEQGRQRLMLHSLVKIAEVLDVEPAELLAYKSSAMNQKNQS